MPAVILGVGGGISVAINPLLHVPKRRQERMGRNMSSSYNTDSIALGATRSQISQTFRVGATSAVGKVRPYRVRVLMIGLTASDGF